MGGGEGAVAAAARSLGLHLSDHAQGGGRSEPPLLCRKTPGPLEPPGSA